MKIYKYGDNVDTDVIIPARYLNSFDAKELASHAMVLILILLKRLNRVILLLLEKILVAVLQENMLLYV